MKLSDTIVETQRSELRRGAARTILATFLLLLVLGSAWAQSEDRPRLYPFRQGEKWGYFDENGQIVVEPTYEEAGHFSDGLGRVLLDGTIRFVDASGIEVLDTGMRAVGEHAEGRIAFKREGEDAWGYLDIEGEVAIEPAFSEAYPFSEGVAAVNISFGSGASASWGYVDREGNLALEPRFYGARRFSEGLAPVMVGGFVDGRWGYIDREGEMRIEPQFDEGLPFSEGLAAVDTAEGFDNSYGYINTDGELVIDGEYLLAREFVHGKAPVAIVDEENWAFIDRKGRPVSRERWPFAEPYRGALARVAAEAGGPGFGHTGGAMSYYYYVEQWRYIDQQGRAVRPGEAAGPQVEASDARRNENDPAAEGGVRLLPPGTLEALLPESLGGLERAGFEADSRTMHGGKVYPEIWATYEASESGSASGPIRTLRLYTAYGAVPQLMVQGELAEEEGYQTLNVGDDTFYIVVGGEESPLFGALFPGEAALFFRAQFDDDTGQAARREAALQVARDIDALRYAELAGRGAPAERGDPVAEGYRRYEARFPGVTMGVDYREGWQPVDLYEMTGIARMIAFSRNPMEGAQILENQSSFSLPSRDSALVTVAFLGPGITPEEYAEAAIDGGAGLAIGERVDGPYMRDDLSLGGSPGVMEVVALAKDSDGREVDYRLLLAEREEGLLAVSIMTPRSGVPIAAATVEAMLSSISIGEG